MSVKSIFKIKLILQLTHSNHLHGHPAPGLSFKVQNQALEIGFYWSWAVCSLELAPVEELHFTFFCCKLPLNQKQLFKTGSKSFFPLTWDWTTRYFVLHSSSMFSFPWNNESGPSGSWTIPAFLLNLTRHTLQKSIFSLLLSSSGSAENSQSVTWRNGGQQESPSIRLTQKSGEDTTWRLGGTWKLQQHIASFTLLQHLHTWKATLGPVA